eukprot:555708-Pyramimonas_sp.AAC.1
MIFSSEAIWRFAQSAIRRDGRLGESRRNALRRQVTSTAGSNDSFEASDRESRADGGRYVGGRTGCVLLG